MHLEHITIENIRGLGVGKPLELSLVPMDRTRAGWNVIVGPNGSGKSTMLRAIALACAGPYVCKVLQPSSAWWATLPARVPGKVKVVLDKGPQDAWFTPDEEWHGVGRRGQVELVVDVQSSAQGVTLKGKGRAELDPEYGPWISFDQTPGWFMAGYGPFRRLARGSSSADSLLGSSARPVAQLASLFREDVALTEPLLWLKQFEMEVREDRPEARSLKPRLLGLISDGLLPGRAKVVGISSSQPPEAVDISSEGLLIREHGRTLPLDALSDGYQTAVGLVIDLVRHFYRAYDKLRFHEKKTKYVVENEGIVLIDEPESHLHPAWQRRLGGWLVEHFPNVQFIVATHSPFICQEATSGSVIRLARPDEDVESRVIRPEELAPILAGSADDIYLSSLFGVDSTRSIVGEQRLDRLAKLEARILDDQATAEEEAEYRRLREQVPPSTDILQALRALEKRR